MTFSKSLAYGIIAWLCLSVTQVLAADDYPTDGRIKILRYDPNDIYTIYTLYGYQTNIEFAKNEEIQTISVGDRSLWQIIPSGARIFIRPMDDSVMTNMTVITNQRTYQFDLKSGKGALEENPRMVYVGRFVYPEKAKPAPFVPAVQAAPLQPVAVSSPQKADPVKLSKPLMVPPPAAPLTSIKPPALPQAMIPDALKPSTFAPPLPPQKSDMMQPVQLSLNHLYTFTGPDALAPVQVYDDGRSTFMRFENMKRLPSITKTDAKGQPQSVPFVVRDGFVVIDEVNPKLALHFMSKDEQVIYVYNEALSVDEVSHGQ